MPWITAADSDIGGREEQQDRYLVEHSDDGNNHLLAVADGAGGHKAGELAAQAAVDCIRENLQYLWSSKDPDTFLHKLIIECNERVLAVGTDDLACTTLVLVLIKGDELYWAHVGDSRFYLIRNREVLVKTTDHSVIELQRHKAAQRAGANITAVPVNASSNKLYMCLGALADIVPDVASSLGREGDTLLLCSDGLWGQIDMEPLIAELSERPLTQDSLNNWTKKARDSKALKSDNITLIAARYDPRQRFWANPIKAVLALFKT